MNTLRIGTKSIGKGNPTFIIAEISGNHHQRYEEAAQLVEAAKKSGADAVKLQTYTPDTMTMNVDSDLFRVGGKDQPDSWKGQKLWDLYQIAHTPWEWQPKLKRFADDLGVILFSTPFDITAVDFLEEKVGVDVYKIASYEAVHTPLQRAIAKKGKPVILSIGFACEEESAFAVQTLKTNGAKSVAVLHCVTAYANTPDLSTMNLATIGDIEQRFNVVAGFSDNNAGILVPIIAAVHSGAAIIEKHLILSRSEGGPDARFSLEPSEFAEMAHRIRVGEREGIEVAVDGIGSMDEVRVAQGSVHYGPASPQEEENKVFRPSIWIQKDIQKGNVLTEDNVRVCRPGYGMAPRFFKEIIGKKAMYDAKRGTPVTEDLLNKVGAVGDR